MSTNGTHSKIEQSLDLADIRQRIGVSLNDISQATKICVRYLRAIEEGDFGKLPGGVYDINYIRQYARAIGLAESDLLAYYQTKVNLEPASALAYSNLESLPIKPKFTGAILADEANGSKPKA